MSESLSKQHFDDALKLYQLEQFSEAREAFLSLVKAYPQHSEIWLNLGNAEFQLNALPNAEKSWKRCLEINPMETKGYLNLGNLYFKQERYKKALIYWQQFVELKPTQPSVWLNMGLASEKLQDLDKAFEYYKKYMQLDPSSTPTRQLKRRKTSAQTACLRNLNTAEQALAKGKLKQAHEAFQKAFEQYPGEAKSYKTFATLLYKQNNMKEALKYYLKSYDLNREDAGVLVNLGVIYEKQHDYAHAMWAYHLALAQNTADRNKVQKRLDNLLANHRESLPTLLKEIQKSLGHARYDVADKELACLQELVTYQADPEFERAVQKEVDALAMAKSPKRRASAVYYREGEVARTQGKYDQALSFYNKYLEAYPKGPHAGEVLQKKSEMETQISQVIATMINMDKPLKASTSEPSSKPKASDLEP